MIAPSNPRAQYLAHKAEIDAAIARVLDRGWYVLGEEVEAFEAEFAAYLGVAHAVGVGSGTEALHLALAACGVGQGNEVITVSHTAVATVAAIELAGATPVFVDIEPAYLTLDPGNVEAAITPRTRAILPVHLYGQPADMAPLHAVARRHGLRLIEDCAQAHGAADHDKKVGTWGDMAAFSFYPTKNLGALGDGGMLVTNDPVLADRARAMREYGWAERYVSRVRGWNTRLDALQAAVLRVKLRSLDEENACRSRLAGLYHQLLAAAGLALPMERPGSLHVYHQYVIRTSRRDALQAFLKARGIGTLVHYPVPVHLQPAYQGRCSGSDQLPETEQAAREVLSLPVYPELSPSDVRAVAESIMEFRSSATAPLVGSEVPR